MCLGFHFSKTLLLFFCAWTEEKDQKKEMHKKKHKKVLDLETSFLSKHKRGHTKKRDIDIENDDDDDVARSTKGARGGINTLLLVRQEVAVVVFFFVFFFPRGEEFW